MAVPLEEFELPEPTDPDECGPVVPSITTRYDLFESEACFEAVDNHAIEVSKMEFGSFRELIWHLTYKQKFSELHIARVCFRWVTVKNMSTIKFDEVEEDSPEYILTGFQRDDGSYPKIYEILCSYSGLQILIVDGHAKGVDYMPGDNLSEMPKNHCWTIVRIDGNWFIVDPHWAMRYVNAENQETTHPYNILPEHNPDLIYEYDNYYFLMDPAQAIYSHFPENPSHTLLPEKYTLDDFTQFPVVKTQFFRSSLTFRGDHRSILFLPNGEAKVVFGYNHSVCFYFKLEYIIDNKVVRKYEGVNVADFTLQETLRNELNFYVRLPFAGDYLLTIYSQINKKDTAIPNTYRAACLYRLVCDSPSKNLIIYPGCPDTNWGPSWAHLDYYGLRALNLREGIIQVSNTAPAYVEAHFKRDRSEVSVLAKLRVRKPDAEIDSADFEYSDNLLEEAEDGYELIFTARLPSKGHYGLEIYANEPDEGDTFTHIAQYLLDFNPNSVSVIKEMPSLQKVVDLPDAYRNIGSESLSCTNVEPSMQSQSVVTPGGPGKFQEDSSTTVSMSENAPNFELKQTEPTESQPVSKSVSKVSLVNYESVFDEDFRSVDTAVEQFKNLNYSTFKELLESLFKGDIIGEKEKARAIFMWLCTKNLAKMTDLEQNQYANVEGSPANCLIGIKNKTKSYSEVFELMCRQADLDCKIVRGHAKGADYNPEVKLEGLVAQHTWNVVSVDKKWYPVDCHWAARRICYLDSENQDIGYALDTFYFLTKPEWFKLSHFPFEYEYQLLQNPMTLKDFEIHPPVKSAYFKYRLKLLTHSEATINATNHMSISLGYCQDNRMGKLLFGFSLTKNGSPIYKDDIPYTRYCIQELYTAQPVVQYRLKFPEDGKYHFTVHCRDLNTPVLTSVCEYIINATVNHPNDPYPPAELPYYGPTEYAFELGISRSFGPIVKINNINADVQLNVSPNNPAHNLPYMTTKVVSNNYVDSDLESSVILRMAETPTGSVIRMTPALPEKGEYCMQVYAQSKDGKEDSFTMIWQFLLEVETPQASIFYLPPVYKDKLGPQGNFYKLNIVPVSHPDAYVYLTPEEYSEPTVDLIVKVDMSNASKTQRICAQFSQIDSNGQELLENQYIFHQKIDDGVEIFVRIPHPGFYRMTLYKTEVNQPVKDIPAIYVYLIEAPPKNDNYMGRIHGPFPKENIGWIEHGGFLYQPLHDGLKTKNQEKAEIRVSIFNALNVALGYAEDKWWELSKVPDTENEWSGKFDLSSCALDKARPLILCARIDGVSSSSDMYSCLLEYLIVD